MKKILFLLTFVFAAASYGAANALSTYPDVLTPLDRRDKLVFDVYTNGTLITRAARSGDLAAAMKAFTHQSGPLLAQDVILDTDLGLDADDIGDMFFAHNLHTAGEINLLAVMASNPNTLIAPAIESLNRYLEHPNIPIGAADNGPAISDAYDANLIAYLPSHIKSSANGVQGATALYRKILAGKPANSVDIVFVGQLRNLYNLWNSAADTNSLLTGAQLITNKVKEIIVVGGIFPTSGAGAEYNFSSDITAAQILNSITVAPTVTFMGIEQGNPIFVPDGIGVDQFGYWSPLRVMYSFYMSVTNRPAWGPLGLWYAARGTSWRGTNAFTATKGFVTVDGAGKNTFANNASANQQWMATAQSTNYYRSGITQVLLEDNHNVKFRGDRVSLSSDTANVPLDFGMAQSGLRSGVGSPFGYVDYVCQNTNIFRMFDQGIAFGTQTGGAGPQGAYWAAGGALGTIIDIGLARSGVNTLRVVGDITSAQPTAALEAFRLRGNDGTQTLPTFSFLSETGTGFWRPGAGLVGLTIGGANKYTFDATKITFPQGYTFFGEAAPVQVADQSVTSSTTLVNSTDLAVAIAASKSYRIRGNIFLNAAGTAAGMKVTFTGPASPTSVIFNVTLTSTGGASSTIANAFGSTVAYSILTTGLRFVQIDGVIVNGANAGTVNFQFAQNTSDANALTLKAGSTLEIKQLN